MNYKILITAILTMLSFSCLAGHGDGRGEGKQYERKANREHEGKRQVEAAHRETKHEVKRNKHKRNPMAATPAIPGHKGQPATPAVPGNPKARENVIENR